MTAVAKSQLNPLANSFIPTSNKDSFQGNEIIQHSIESNSKTNWEESKKNSSNVWSEMAFSRFTSVISFFLRSSSFLGQKPPVTSNVPLLPERSRDHDFVLVTKSKADLSESAKISLKEYDALKEYDKEIECKCPPMFGWILPPDFSGNLFNQTYECSKRYPHCPDSVEQEFDDCSLDSHDEINKLTLDECYSELKDILVDVYETISTDLDPVSNWDEKPEIHHYLEASDINFDNESQLSNLDSTSKNSTDAELIDDGCHPLLESVPAREEDHEDLVEKVEKILGKSLSPLPESRDSTLNTGTVCDPPCSVWCEFLPEAAKETFLKYVQISKNKDTEAVYQLSFKHKPVYKRSLSADDATMLGRFNENLGYASALESREILHRKDPLDYVNSRDNARKNGKHGSCHISGESSGNSNTESSMWGKFDGADSLWKPLPECMPVNDYNFRSCPKRGREIRRQRSVN